MIAYLLNWASSEGFHQVAATLDLTGPGDDSYVSPGEFRQRFLIAAFLRR